MKAKTMIVRRSLLAALFSLPLLPAVLGGMAGAGLLAQPALAAPGAGIELGGLKSAAPPAWKDTPPTSPMRIKQLTVPGKGGENAGDAELVIFYFGEGQGGSVDDNLARWKQQFEVPAGKTADDISKVETVKLSSKAAAPGGGAATVLDISGTYLFKARPMDPGPGEPRPNYRMLAAVLPTPKGNYFIRLVGPEKTVGGARKDFVRWLKGFK